MSAISMRDCPHCHIQYESINGSPCHGNHLSDLDTIQVTALHFQQTTTSTLLHFLDLPPHITHGSFLCMNLVDYALKWSRSCFGFQPETNSERYAQGIRGTWNQTLTVVVVQGIQPGSCVLLTPTQALVAQT